MKKLLLTLIPALFSSQVGINTDKPKETLHVVGTVRITDMPIVDKQLYLVASDEDGKLYRILLSSVISTESDCPEFLKAESSPYYLKFRSKTALSYPPESLTINNLSFTKSGYWVNNGYHYYSWSNTSGQPLNINDFSVNFGNKICKYQ